MHMQSTIVRFQQFMLYSFLNNKILNNYACAKRSSKTSELFSCFFKRLSYFLLKIICNVSFEVCVQTTSLKLYQIFKQISSSFHLERFDHNNRYSCQLSTSHIHTGCYQHTDLKIKAHQMESLSTTYSYTY